jgi:DNA polymerase III gamma/tau subunit
MSENIDIEPDAEEFIVTISNRTIKTIISYMEKFKLLNTKITLELAMKLCTNISFYTFEQYSILLKEKKINDAIMMLYDIYDKGYSVMDILDNFFIFIKSSNFFTDEQKYNIIPYICKYITIFNNIHEDEIELALFTNNLISII